MSKAFTKEDDVGIPEPVRRALPASAVHLTRAGAERLRTELQDLQRRRADIASAGDLPPLSVQNRENIDRQIREIQQTLAFAIIVETSESDSDVVQFGATVTVRSRNDGEEARYRIVGPAEADIGRGWISSVSPLAKALLNRKVGERVLFKYPAGEDTLEILSVEKEI